MVMFRVYKLIACCFVITYCPLSLAHHDPDIKCCGNSYKTNSSVCRPWYCHYNITNSSQESEKCNTFGRKIDHTDIIRQNDNKTLALLQLGYCMTYDNDTPYIISCPYDVATSHTALVMGQSLEMDTTLEKLTNFTCSQLNRHMKHCAQCIDGYGQSVFTMDLGCYPCSERYSGWGLYLAFEFVPITVFIVLLLVLQLSPTRPDMKAFILFAQIATLTLSLNYEPPYKHIFNSKAPFLVKIIKAAYGFWNLDFFRSVVPPFCVSPHLNNLEVLSLQYMSVIYPTILAVLAWILVDLHERGCRLIVRMWKPFRSYLSHYSVTNDPKRGIVSFFAAIVVLSYTKVIYISAHLLGTVREQAPCSEDKVLFLQPDLKYFSQQHVAFVLVALTMLLIYTVLPLLILLLYVVELFQDKLKSFCVRHSNIQMFAETFYGCYLDGSNETKDRRLFSTLYLFHRILFVLLMVKIGSTLWAFIIASFGNGVFVGILFTFRPYKEDSYNYLDITFFSIFTTTLLIAGFSTRSPTNVTISNITLTGILIAMFVPLLYASIRVLRVLIKWLKLIDVKSVIQRRRRGYVEIRDYGDERTSSCITEQGARGNGRRSKEKPASE